MFAFKRKLFWVHFSFAFSILCMVNALSAQTTIKGKVLEGGAYQPLAGVNVYISGTTIGASTNPEGEFEFTTRLQGKVVVIASFLGFKTGAKEQVIQGADELVVNFILTEDLLFIGEIEVRGEKDKEWERLYKDFGKFFIGEGQFAEQTEILNPEMIDFSRVDRDRVFVSSKQPLKIFNNALGYNIEVTVDKMYFDPKTHAGYWNVYAHFELMESGSFNQQKKWEQNREKAYLGSQKHFFVSLVDDVLKEEKFIVAPDTLAVQKLENLDLVATNFPSNWETIIENYHVFKVKDINFGVAHDPLLTWNGKPKSETEYSTFEPNNPSRLIIVDDLGTIFNSEDVVFLGPWSQNRFAKTLPLDYGIYARVN